MSHATTGDVQQATVPTDRPCEGCGYNLRGQTCAWDRGTLKWRCTCPECGQSQAIIVDADRRGAVANPLVVLAVSLLCLWVTWKLLYGIAVSEAAMIRPADGAQTLQQVAAMSARRNAAATPTPDSLEGIVTHLLTHGIPLALCAAGIGVIASLAPYAREAQRTALCLALVALAGVVGVWMYLSGYMDASNGDTSMQLALAMQSRAVAAASAREWNWPLSLGVSGMLIGFVAARIGQSVGRPLVRSVVSMFVPPEHRPQSLER